MQQSIDIRIMKTEQLTDDILFKITARLTKRIQDRYPSVTVRIRSSTNSGAVISGFNKSEKKILETYLEELFEDSTLLDD